MPSYEIFNAAELFHCPICRSTDVRYNRTLGAWYCKRELCSGVWWMVSHEGQLFYRIVEDEDLAEAEADILG
jgi:hypothetical protein